MQSKAFFETNIMEMLVLQNVDRSSPIFTLPEINKKIADSRPDHTVQQYTPVL